MTEQELRIAKLSKIMNSGLRMKTSHAKAQNEAHQRAINSLTKSLEVEKQFNLLSEKKQQLLEKAEQEQRMLKESIYKHHFDVLQKQIEEKKRAKEIEVSSLIKEQEMAEETYKPKPVKIKEFLDAQVEEKKKIQEEIKIKDQKLDQLRVELAAKSLEKEIKTKFEGKMILQNQLRKSWEKTENTNKLQKVIERIRRFGDTYVIDEDELGVNVKNTQNLLKNTQNLLKITQGLSRESKKTEKSKRPENGLLKKKSKSVLSNYSNSPNKDFMQKLQKLKEVEDKIKKEKIEILSFLESRGHSKISSRPVTSLLN